MIGACILLGAPASRAQDEQRLPPDCIDRSADGTCKYLVSLVRLLADPKEYDGKRIMLVGFLHLEFEGNAIYIHRDDKLYRISKNALWVSFSPGINTKACQDKYVLIEGEFSATETGHMGLFGGTVKAIDRCVPLPTR
jgi:hypothetical protein